ncbi:MAG: hypothetical protein ACT4P5_13990 [Armatimonadota bacterium]
MHFSVRSATAEDGATLVRLLDAAYSGGYSATFDRDGPLQPNDLWWVQSEKDVSVVEVDRRPNGLVVVGRLRGQWLVEEALLQGFGEFTGRTQEACVQRMGAHLTALFRRGRQSVLLLRTAETNAFGLALARSLHATLANALLVYRYHGARKPAAHAPEGYQVRRSAPADASAMGRLLREIVIERSRVEEIERALGSKGGRGYLAMKDRLLVGFAAVEVRAGRRDWLVGVRESHRRRGVGRALAASALGALYVRDVIPFATTWALDPVVGSFLRALGFAVERTYLYMEHRL